MSTLLLTGTTQDKSKVEISQNFVTFSEYMNFESSSFSSDPPAHTSFPALVATQYTQRPHLSASQSPLSLTAEAGTERNWEENYWEDDLHLCTAAAAALQKYICNFPLKILDWSQTCNFGTSCTFFHHDDDDDASEIIHCRSWSLQQQLSPALSSSAFANERKVQNNSELPKHFSYAVTKDSLVNWVVGQQICNQK